ncbi:hypothetical protein FQN57_000814 [Myotisia sp. PD_48]|nr:hypothetical protein FQN57_000814 [Myotisia sp. PD_48]
MTSTPLPADKREPYTRQARRKTREDRYKPKVAGPPHGKASRIGQKKPSVSKRGKNKSSIPTLEYKAQPPNVVQDRLTLRSSGLFRHGRASSPVRRTDLPNLSFSEVDFLSSKPNGKENQTQVEGSSPPSKNSCKRGESWSAEIKPRNVQTDDIRHPSQPFSESQDQFEATGLKLESKSHNRAADSPSSAYSWSETNSIPPKKPRLSSNLASPRVHQPLSTHTRANTPHRDTQSRPTQTILDCSSPMGLRVNSLVFRNAYLSNQPEENDHAWNYYTLENLLQLEEEILPPEPAQSCTEEAGSTFDSNETDNKIFTRFERQFRDAKPSYCGSKRVQRSEPDEIVSSGIFKRRHRNNTLLSESARLQTIDSYFGQNLIPSGHSLRPCSARSAPAGSIGIERAGNLSELPCQLESGNSQPLNPIDSREKRDVSKENFLCPDDVFFNSSSGDFDDQFSSHRSISPLTSVQAGFNGLGHQDVPVVESGSSEHNDRPYLSNFRKITPDPTPCDDIPSTIVRENFWRPNRLY